MYFSFNDFDFKVLEWSLMLEVYYCIDRRAYCKVLVYWNGEFYVCLMEGCMCIPYFECDKGMWWLNFKCFYQFNDIIHLLYKPAFFKGNSFITVIM